MVKRMFWCSVTIPSRYAISHMNCFFVWGRPNQNIQDGSLPFWTHVYSHKPFSRSWNPKVLGGYIFFNSFLRKIVWFLESFKPSPTIGQENLQTPLDLMFDGKTHPKKNIIPFRLALKTIPVTCIFQVFGNLRKVLLFVSLCLTLVSIALRAMPAAALSSDMGNLHGFPWAYGSHLATWEDFVYADGWIDR